MSSIEPKKMALLRILQILNEHSDYNHPLTHEEIIEKLYSLYGIELERKAVGRHINDLIDIFEKDALNNKNGEYMIITSDKKRGTYVEKRVFEDAELRMLIDAVLSSKYIHAKHSTDLINKLCSLSNKYFKSNIKNVYSINDWNKSDNFSLFYNIDLIDEAIDKNIQIKFNYNKYGIDKKLHQGVDHIISPYQLILHNQRYYLMALEEKWKSISYYRLDQIKNMELLEDKKSTPLREVEGYENGIDYKDLSSSRPYMYTDKAEWVEFYAREAMLSQIIDWFGNDIEIEKVEDKKIKVKLKVSLDAMTYWALQYVRYVEIISPITLRERVKKNLEIGLEKYR